MMRTLFLLVLGIAIGAGVGFALGYNYGRGAPLLTNPFAEYSFADKTERQVDELLRDAKRAIHDATAE